MFRAEYILIKTSSERMLIDTKGIHINEQLKTKKPTLKVGFKNQE